MRDLHLPKQVSPRSKCPLSLESSGAHMSDTAVRAPVCVLVCINHQESDLFPHQQFSRVGNRSRRSRRCHRSATRADSQDFCPKNHARLIFTYRITARMSDNLCAHPYRCNSPATRADIQDFCQKRRVCLRANLIRDRHAGGVTLVFRRDPEASKESTTYQNNNA